jgi:hypothetical protein
MARAGTGSLRREPIQTALPTSITLELAAEFTELLKKLVVAGCSRGALLLFYLATDPTYLGSP